MLYVQRDLEPTESLATCYFIETRALWDLAYSCGFKLCMAKDFIYLFIFWWLAKPKEKIATLILRAIFLPAFGKGETDESSRVWKCMFSVL